MSQFPACAANHMFANRLLYSIMTVPRPGWRFHSLRVRSRLFSLLLISWSTPSRWLLLIGVSLAETAEPSLGESQWTKACAERLVAEPVLTLYTKGPTLVFAGRALRTHATEPASVSYTHLTLPTI